MSRASVRAGVLAARPACPCPYVAALGGVGGFAYLPGQVWDGTPWLVMTLAGFGARVGLYVELRRRQLRPH